MSALLGELLHDAVDLLRLARQAELGQHPPKCDVQVQVRKVDQRNERLQHLRPTSTPSCLPTYLLWELVHLAEILADLYLIDARLPEKEARQIAGCMSDNAGGDRGLHTCFGSRVERLYRLGARHLWTEPFTLSHKV